MDEVVGTLSVLFIPNCTVKDLASHCGLIVYLVIHMPFFINVEIFQYVYNTISMQYL
jgi:hypothetical protein